METYNFAIQMWKNGDTKTRIGMVMIFGVTLVCMIIMFKLSVYLA